MQKCTMTCYFTLPLIIVKMCNGQLTFAISIIRGFSVLCWWLQECMMTCIVIIGIYETIRKLSGNFSLPIPSVSILWIMENNLQ